MLKSLKLELTCAIALFISTPAIAAPLENWNFDPNTNQLEVTVPAGITPRYSLMAQPTRIVLDLPDTQIAGVSPKGTFSGAVREVRVSQFQPNTARIVLELAPNTELSNPQAQLQQIKSSDQGRSSSASGNVRWMLRPMLATATNPEAVSSAVQPVQPSVQASKSQTPQMPDSQASDLQSSRQATSIAQTSANDFGLPPAPPAINVAPETPPAVTAPPLPPAQSRPLPATPPAPTTGSSSRPGSSLLFPTAPARSTTQSNPLQLPEVNSSLEIPRSFPPVIAPTAQPAVAVPQIEQQTEPPKSTQRAFRDTPVPARSRVIEFGQPLPQ